MIARIWRGAADDQFLIERDLTVHHYEVAGTE
jgi:hypothetical protein